MSQGGEGEREVLVFSSHFLCTFWLPLLKNSLKIFSRLMRIHLFKGKIKIKGNFIKVTRWNSSQTSTIPVQGTPTPTYPCTQSLPALLLAPEAGSTWTAPASGAAAHPPSLAVPENGSHGSRRCILSRGQAWPAPLRGCASSERSSQASQG